MLTAEISKQDNEEKQAKEKALIQEKEVKQRRLKELQAKLAEIEAIEDLSTKMKTEKELFLDEILQILEQEQKKDHILSTIINCRKIIEMTEDLENVALHARAKSIFVDFEQKLKEHHRIQDEETKAVMQQINDLEQIINIEDTVAPEIEDIPISLFIGNINEDLLNMQELADQVLVDHAVEIQEYAESKAIIKHVSGKAREITQEIDVLWEFADDKPSLPDYVITNTIENFADDPIEEAFIQDIIPYNYEISEVTINGNTPQVDPHQQRMKDGLQYSWYIPEAKKDNPIEFKYHLKPRISRTVVLPLKNSLKVIKTHSSLNNEKIVGEKKKQDEGIFDALLKFKNSYENQLSDIVLEDVIPIFYTYEVEEQKSGDFPSVKESSESFVKWKLDEMPIEQTSLHEYHLIELQKIEELKIEAHNVLKQDPEKVSKHKRKNILKRQERARNFLQKFNL
ncbi:hypothetical protein [Candidatus Lokiarchaeum ossiferum]|uniref:hypothetical protein n=1 Tax=Candidatus Lokiarchaeum ossiferum TaxID=2951803 RepID=UPI00352FB8A4